MEIVYFVLEQSDFATLLNENLQFSLQVALLVIQQSSVRHPFSEGSFSSSQSGLLDFDLLIEECGLIVSANELGSKDISLGKNKLVFVLFVLPFGFKLFDAGVEFGNFVVEVLDDFSLRVHLFLLLFQLSAVLK